MAGTGAADRGGGGGCCGGGGGAAAVAVAAAIAVGAGGGVVEGQVRQTLIARRNGDRLWDGLHAARYGLHFRGGCPKRGEPRPFPTPYLKIVGGIVRRRSCSGITTAAAAATTTDDRAVGP